MTQSTQKPKIFVSYCAELAYYIAISISKNLLAYDYRVVVDKTIEEDTTNEVTAILAQELTVCDYCVLILTLGNADNCAAYLKHIIDLAQEHGSTIIPILVYGFELTDYQEFIKQPSYSKLADIQPHKLSLDKFEHSMAILCNNYLISHSISLNEITDSTHQQIMAEQHNFLQNMSTPTQNELMSEAFFGYGLLAFKHENYDEAVEAFNKAIRFNNQNTMAYYYRGSALIHLVDYPNALADLNQSIKLSPANSSAYYNRAMLYNARGDLRLALDDLIKSIELNPHRPLAYRLRASIRYKFDDISRCNY